MENAMLRRKYNQYKNEAEITKNKKIKLVDNRPIILCLKIFHANDIDEPNLYPSVVNRYYGAIVRVRPGQEKITRIVNGQPNPIWLEETSIFLGKDPYDYPFLHVEVLRFNSVNDPGTSSGTVVVGKAMIPFPEELNQIKEGNFGLVRAAHEGGGTKAEGEVVLSMELKKFMY